MARQYIDGYDYTKHRIRKFLEQQGLGAIYRVRWTAARPSYCSVTYPYFTILETDGTRFRQVAKGYDGDEVMKNFCQLFRNGAALFNEYKAFRI